MIVYLAKNTVNGKCYVGCTIRTIEKRKLAHFDRSIRGNGAFQRAIRKYGTISFEWEVLERCFNVEVMFEREKFWIQELNTISPNGYNLTIGGEGVVNLAEESRAKQVASHLGKKQTEETKQRRSKSLKKAYADGKRIPIVMSDEHKEKFLKHNLGKSSWNKGVKWSESSKNKMAIAKIGKHKIEIPSICFDRIGEEI